jgi:hypothetical protein
MRSNLLEVHMSNIFDDARKELEEEAIRKNEVSAGERAEQERKEGELASARLRLRQVYAQIPELHTRLTRSRMLPPCAEGEWRTGIRSLTAGSIHPVLVKKPGGKRGWPLANVHLPGRRRVQTGGNSWSGTAYGWRDVTIGVQGIVLLEDGCLYEHRQLADSEAISIDRRYDMMSDLPPRFVMELDNRAIYDSDDQLALVRMGDDRIEQQTYIIKRWTGELEEAMKTLAVACLRRAQGT